MEGGRSLPTADEVAAALRLEPHPEGGFFRETYRSPLSIQTANGERSLSTAILFLVAAGRPSRFHRLAADELWIHQAGAPLELVLLPPGGEPDRVLLGVHPGTDAGTAADLATGVVTEPPALVRNCAPPVAGAGPRQQARIPAEAAREERPVCMPQALVPAGVWQAARMPAGTGTKAGRDWSLVACLVTPGFDYRDFEMAARDTLLAAYPAFAELISALT